MTGMRTARVTKLSALFALIYFFSPNGLGALSNITASFLLKDTLKMTATAAAYFSAMTIFGWVLKPLWGMLSDFVPLFGSRRRSYLLLTACGAAAVWLYIGSIESYTVRLLLASFALSSFFYAFMDVLCDALMVETGKPQGLTGKFQAIQWTAVYAASIITGVLGGYAAAHWPAQAVFTVTGIMPLVIAIAVLAFAPRESMGNKGEHKRNAVAGLKAAFGSGTFWLLAGFLFLWTFSPSFGAPFFYYAVDALGFKPQFLGWTASIAAAGGALGALWFARWGSRYKTRRLLRWMIILGTLATLFDLIYLTGFMQANPALARAVYGGMAFVLGSVAAVAMVSVMNAAALAAPRYAEGTAFAFLTAFYNLGTMGSTALGGYVFGITGLGWLIVISAACTALAGIALPFLVFADERDAVVRSTPHEDQLALDI